MTAREPDLPRETLERAARGDPDAFEAIVRRFERPVHALVHRLAGGDAEAARDLTQDVFLKAWQNLGRYDASRPFAPWFLRLAANLAINAREARSLRRTRSLDAPTSPGERAPEHPPDPRSPPPAERAAEDEARDAVRRGVADLEGKYALPVTLFYLEGLSVTEIARRLELPEGTVKIRLHRARDLLEERLRRFGEGAPRARPLSSKPVRPPGGKDSP